MFNPLKYPIIFEKPRLTTSLSAWQGHIPFAMLLVQTDRPKILVELGTHAGASYSAFCQAVEQSKTDTKCFAIDTWMGDDNTAAFEYGVDVLKTLREYHDPLYGSFSSLIQSTFDDALPSFADGSIDLLHIDGLHTYEAVKHDFETWLPKMREDGVVLFHDIMVYQKLFGVHRLWKEIKGKYAHFEFHHCNGLGVIALDWSHASPLGDILSASPTEADILRAFFRGTGNSLLEEQYTDLNNRHNRVVTSRVWKVVSSIKKVLRPRHVP